MYLKNIFLFLLILFSSLVVNANVVAPAIVAPKSNLVLIKTQEATLPKVVFFYSNACPHCQYMRDYISKHHIDKKFNIVQKEVAVNQENNREFLKILRGGCVTTKEVELPVVWDGKKCWQGVEEVTNFFEPKEHAK